MTTTKHMLRTYYAHPDIRARIAEFLGGPAPEHASCVDITGTDDSPEVHLAPRPPRDLWSCLDEGLGVARSLWDHEALIAHLDLDYVSFDFPGEPYLDPVWTIELQRPGVDAIQAFLQGYGIEPLHLLSGRVETILSGRSSVIQAPLNGWCTWDVYLDPSGASMRNRTLQPTARSSRFWGKPLLD